jgi:hypothetical protein
MTLTELVETGIQGTTDANGQVTLYLPADTYRFRTDIYGHQYYSDENALTIVPTDTTASVTVPVFGAVTVTAADSDHEPVPDLAVYAYLGQDEYVGISGGTDFYGKTTLMLPEGTYRFKTEQYGIEFWSNATANCNTPTECTTASITVIGRDYLANDQTIDYTNDDLAKHPEAKLSGEPSDRADYDIGWLYYLYTYFHFIPVDAWHGGTGSGRDGRRGRSGRAGPGVCRFPPFFRDPSLRSGPLPEWCSGGEL